MIIKPDEVSSNRGGVLSNLLPLISHEIRTPMNSIIGVIDLLLNTELNDEQKELMTILKSSTNCLENFLNTIIDFSKIETGKIEIEQIEFQFHDFIHEIMKSFTFAAHEKGIELIYHISSNVPLDLIGDSKRLGQIIMNILNSAIKHTFKGEVMLYIGIMIKKIIRKMNISILTFQFMIQELGLNPRKNQKKLIRSLS